MTRKFFVSAFLIVSLISVAFGSTTTDELLSVNEEVAMHNYGTVIENENIIIGRVINTNRLNVRSRPSVEGSKILGQLDAGEEVQISRVYQGDTVTWYLIFDGSPLDLYGWVSGKYIQPDTEISFAQYPSNSNNDVETIDIEALAQEYLANPFRAKNAYNEKNIRVRGKIYKITSNSKGYPIVMLQHNSVNAQCIFSDADPLLSDISVGKTVTIQGGVVVNTRDAYQAYGLVLCEIISID